jgi:hypothetical protein
MVGYKRRNIISEHSNNLTILVALAISLIGVIVGETLDVFAGELYYSLILGSMVIITLFGFFTNSDDKKEKSLFFESPFKKNPKVALALFFIGLLFIFLINFVAKNFFSFSVLNFFSPLYLSAGQGLSSGLAQSFSASVLESSPVVTYFFTVIIAGLWEEFIFGFGLFLVGWIFALLVNHLFFGNNLSREVVFWVAMAFSVLGFSAIHLFNGSYEGIMFVVAGAFRLIMNIIIFKFRFGMAFTMAMHIGNNHLAYYGVYGFQTFMIIEILIVVALLVSLMLPFKKTGNFDTLLKDLWAETLGGRV